MKRSRAAWLSVAIVLLLVVLLVLFLPARWAAPFVQSRLHGVRLERVHGLVWDGAAEQLRGPDGRSLGAVHWRLSRRALWGRLDLQLAFDGPMLAARGRLQRDAQGRPVWSDVALRSDLATWAPRLDTSLGSPQGTLTATLQRVVLQANWPVELDGRAQWGDAAMQTPAQAVGLGDWVMTLDGANGVLHGELHDQGKGPLHVEGQWQASPLGWRLDLLLQPRTADPALRRWLARLGRPDADGSVHLHRRNGLAAATPETTR
ncbi:type II secretion system protein N [Frateuria terrea]|uniref:Type II secretion system protein N n=1 Tax=Frateuria terrea TaxID=529704 RepID=A0A1H6XN78_9GAMM|nr:type II secretion system protein N [Frateuria terrea]SEJ30529.1 type II secretion system protein N (GspN) [Frateuria terrea]SFP52695.1 type II secretion system protein N (GspN) [Frateuria terrea]